MSDRQDKDRNDEGKELSSVTSGQMPTGEEDRDSTQDDREMCNTQFDTGSVEKDKESPEKTKKKTTLLMSWCVKLTVTGWDDFVLMMVQFCPDESLCSGLVLPCLHSR